MTPLLSRAQGMAAAPPSAAGGGAAPAPFRIGTLPVGPGWLGLARCPGSATPLADDLAAVAGWGAGAVLTLLGPPELAALGAAGLPDAVRAAGMDWLHMPIDDFAAPGPAALAAWAVAGPEVAARLAAGGRVLVHCRAGLGRSGTVAAMVLVEAGLAPEAALAAVRAARPGAVETPGQAAFVLGWRAGGTGARA